MKLRGILFFQILCSMLFFSSCSNNPPEILQSYWQITLVELSGSTDDSLKYQEELSVFTLSRDEDGEDEIESIYIIEDEEEIFWELTADNWEEIELQGEKWLGASSLLMPWGEEFPRDDYRVLVIDKSGQRGDTVIGVSVKNLSAPPDFPRLIQDDELWMIESPHKRHTLRVYSQDGNIKKEIKIQETRFSDQFLKNELKPSSGDSIVVFADDDSNGWVLMSLPLIYD